MAEPLRFNPDGTPKRPVVTHGSPLPIHQWVGGLGTPCGIPIDDVENPLRSTPDRSQVTCVNCLLMDRSNPAHLEEWLDR